MYATDYTKPGSRKAAAVAVAGAADGKFLAGGMTLIPTMKQRLAAPDLLVDVTACGLGGIAIGKNGVSIGATMTHAAVAAHAGIRRSIPALAALAEGIGDRQVRNRGTIGGSVANNDPAACYPAAVLALDGTVLTDRREIPAGDFFTGLFETALREHELITAVAMRKPASAAYVKFPNPASRYALAGVFVARRQDGGVRVAVTGAGNDGVFRWRECESALEKNFTPDAVAGVAGSLNPDSLMADIHAPAAYRAQLVGEMARRAVMECR